MKYRVLLCLRKSILGLFIITTIWNIQASPHYFSSCESWPLHLFKSLPWNTNSIDTNWIDTFCNTFALFFVYVKQSIWGFSSNHSVIVHHDCHVYMLGYRKGQPPTAGGAVLSLPTPAARGQRCREENEMDHDTIHEINTWKCPVQTQCG